MIESICKSLVPVWTLMLNDPTDAELDAELVTDVDQYTHHFLSNHLSDNEFVEMMKHQLQLRYLECTNGMTLTVSEDGSFNNRSSDHDMTNECNPIAQLYEMIMYDLDIEPIKITNISDMNIFATINAETDELLNMIASDYPQLNTDD